MILFGPRARNSRSKTNTPTQRATLFSHKEPAELQLHSERHSPLQQSFGSINKSGTAHPPPLQQSTTSSTASLVSKTNKRLHLVYPALARRIPRFKLLTAKTSPADVPTSTSSSSSSSAVELPRPVPYKSTSERVSSTESITRVVTRSNEEFSSRRMSHNPSHDEDAVAAADKEMEERANRAKELLSQRYVGLKRQQVRR